MPQTDNSYLADKVALRVGHLPAGEPLRVLDCFGGRGLIWRAVAKLSGRAIGVLPIDKLDYGFRLPGDNLGFLEALDLTCFDVVDLDAYGVPYEQLETLFRRGYRSVVFVTFIQSVFGGIPTGLLLDIGFTREMIEKCPTLFYKNGWSHMRAWLAERGITRIWHRSRRRKHYFGFDMQALKSSLT